MPQRMAKLIAMQQRPMLFAGYFGSASDGPQAGEYSKPVPALARAGLKAYDLAVNTDPGWFSSEKQRQVPLQLKAAIKRGFFANALANPPDDIHLPADAVIDWTLDWGAMLRRIRPAQLTTLEEPVLLVGTDAKQIKKSRTFLIPPPLQSCSKTGSRPSTVCPEQWSKGTGAKSEDAPLANASLVLRDNTCGRRN